MTSHEQTFDLGIALSWRYDREFVALLESVARERGVSTFVIHADNLHETLDGLRHHKFFFRFLLDRASDEDEAFLPFARHFTRKREGASTENQTHIINHHHLLSRAADKATMHLEFLTKGIEVPYTIIISPFNHKRELEFSITELAHLGRPFIIKPANTTGGGIGVVTGAETLKDVLDARQHHKNDKYLLQETIRPAYLSDERGWFRVFFAFGDIIPCWWDDQTHIYEEVTAEQEELFGLQPLRDITSQIREVCQLEFFSTEIAYTTKGRFVVVDYVNELCDMRLQSLHPDGVPDSIVLRIAEHAIEFVTNKSGVKAAHA